MLSTCVDVVDCISSSSSLSACEGTAPLIGNMGCPILAILDINFALSLFGLLDVCHRNVEDLQSHKYDRILLYDVEINLWQ